MARWSTVAKSYPTRALTLGGLGVRQLIVQVRKRIDEDDVFGRAAQLSYYFVLSLVPLLIFFSALLGYFFAAERGIYLRLINYLGRVMPQPAFELLRGTLEEITNTAGTGKLTIGVSLTLWSASSGMEAVINGLNVAYSVPEARPWWRRRLVALGLTVALGGFATIALFLILASDTLARSIGQYFPVLEWIGRWSSAVQWIIGLCSLLLGLTLVFRFAPNLRQSRWEANAPGALLALICWILASAGFKLYLSSFGAFNRTYGSLGAVIVLLIWLYVSGAAILIGGELNSVIWQAVLRRSKAQADADSKET